MYLLYSFSYINNGINIHGAWNKKAIVGGMGCYPCTFRVENIQNKSLSQTERAGEQEREEEEREMDLKNKVQRIEEQIISCTRIGSK